MYIALVSLVVLLAILMCLIVLIQESKGGGLASSFASSNQILGVRKTTDLIEKITWGLAAAIVVFSVISVFFIPKASSEESVLMNATPVEQAVNSNNLPNFGAAQTSEPVAPVQEAPAQ